MQNKPDTSHDWVLWMFEYLEQVENFGLYWQGTLPQNFSFDEFLNSVPDNILGLCTESTRKVEFYPRNASVFENINEFVSGANRRNAPKIFTIRDLNYTHGKTETLPKIVSNYLDAVKLWKLLVSFSDFEREHSVFFIKSFESKIEIRPEYNACDLLDLKNLDTFAGVYFDSEHHKEQKRNIVRASLLDTFKNELAIPLSQVILKYDDFVERVKASYSMYTADFSFEKLHSEVEKQNVEDTLRINKVLSDIQNQMLALPASLLIASTGVKNGSWAINLSIFIGLSIFSWMVWHLIKNQENTLNSIEIEIKNRIDKIKLQPKDISEKILNSFTSLNTRIQSQKKLLANLMSAVFFIWGAATLITIHAQFWDILHPIIFSEGFE